MDNAPAQANGIMRLFGGTPNLNILNFSVPVVDPVVAIWSLGQVNLPASFVFDNALVLVAGGPSTEYGGSSIGVIGTTVFGEEGNGTVRFLGTYTSITWVNPVFEDWYGFNVGVAGTGAAAVPEPASLSLLGAGAVGLLGYARRRKAVA